MRLERAFREVLREHYPQAPHLADMVTLEAMQASFAKPRSPAEQAAHEAQDMLKAAIIDGRIALEGCLDGHLCGPIGAAEITTSAQINVFGSTVHIRHGRTYHDVCCSDEAVAALISRMAAAPVPADPKDRPPALSPDDAVIALIVAHKDSDRLKEDIKSDARKIPDFQITNFESLWKDYASEYQKRPGARPRSVAAS